MSFYEVLYKLMVNFSSFANAQFAIKYMPQDEIQLVSEIISNSESAFNIVYKKYYPRLYYFIFEFIPFHDLAENIVQDTFLTLWNKRNDLHADTNLGAYLFTVARNNCLYRLRDERYKQRFFVNATIDDSELQLNLEALSLFDSSSYMFDEIERIINKTLEELPPQCRKVFLLSRFQLKKNKEIAEDLNISVKVVEKHISKGLKLFRKALKDYLPFVAYLFVS